MRSIRDWRAPCIVIGQNGGEQIDWRGAHAIELRKVSVAVAEEAQHRHDPVDGVIERLRWLQLTSGKQLTQRQQVGQQFNQRAGISAGVAAVRQNLRAQFVDRRRTLERKYPDWPCMQSVAYARA